MDITNERALSPQEVSSLVAAFLREHPAEFARWVELEKGETGVEPIWETAIAFLKRHCRHNTRSDLTTAALAMRVEFYRTAHQDKS